MLQKPIKKIMNVEELYQTIEKIKTDHPNVDVDKMEIGPLFSNDVVMMVSELQIIKDAGWNGKDAIGIIWHC